MKQKKKKKRKQLMYIWGNIETRTSVEHMIDFVCAKTI